MKGTRDRATVKHGLKLLIAKVILGAVAAVAGMVLMRVASNREVIVALCIGLVPGVAERSLKKLVMGLLFGFVGYVIGVRISAALAKAVFIQELPMGHWGITGAFIGMTAGLSGTKGQWFSFRFIVWCLGATCGLLLGFVFGLMGDIGGLFTIPLSDFSLFYYLREVSLLCAGVFINLGVGLATILAASLNNGLLRVARVVEKVEA